jgi:SNF2 family DNA or RNA helicase
VHIWKEGNRIFFKFPFKKLLKEEIKAMQGARWHGYASADNPNPRPLWSVQDTQRNHFQLRYLQGENVYARYDLPQTPVPVVTRYNKSTGQDEHIFKHQIDMASEILTRHFKIIAGDMGTGKSLATIIAAEYALQNDLTSIWYIGPRAGRVAVERELKVWQAKIKPMMFTYEGLVTFIKNLEGKDFDPPRFVWFDESSKVKNGNSQRGQAAKILADAVRDKYGEDGYVVLTTGTPAPKSPVDWYHQAEITEPGFLKEGDVHKFKHRLGVIIEKETFGGGVYPQLVTWRDSTDKCNVCGELKGHENHDPTMALCSGGGEKCHSFEPGVNEVERLYKRLKGLVSVYFKKDCLDLPDKHYKPIKVKPDQTILRVAETIAKTSKSTIEGLTRLRELSDGFQYVNKHTGRIECPRCKGSKIATEYEEIPNTCPNCKDWSEEERFYHDEYGKHETSCPRHFPERKSIEGTCSHCKGSGQIAKLERTTQQVTCPKDKVLQEILDEHDDIGRIVIYAGFTGSIDRVIKVCQKVGWCVIRVDQGSWHGYTNDGSPLNLKTDELYEIFQSGQSKFPRVAFVANPGSGGMALTLTASPTIVYFSNTFMGDDRMQSEDRIHRPGMDLNRGATIVDIIHLPSDEKVLANLKKKRDLQSMSMGDFV